MTNKTLCLLLLHCLMNLLKTSFPVGILIILLTSLKIINFYKLTREKLLKIMEKNTI